MKRSLIYVLIIGLLLALASCTGETPNVPENSGDTPSIPTTPDAPNTDIPSIPEDSPTQGDDTAHPYLAIKKNGSIYCTDKTVTEVVIPEYINNIKVTGITDRAFYNCEVISVKIPDSVTSIGDYAFRDCSSLESIYIDQEKDSLDLRYANIPSGATVYWKGEFEL